MGGHTIAKKWIRNEAPGIHGVGQGGEATRAALAGQDGCGHRLNIRMQCQESVG